MKKFLVRVIGLTIIFNLYLGYSSLRASEYLMISGGPALRLFEHSKEHSHDKYWGNFIDAAVTRIKQVRPELSSGDKITWLVYRPSYESRGREEKINLIAEVESRAKSLNVPVVWFNTRDELLNYLNKRDRSNLVCGLEYFGHSNKRNWMFDYSNALDGGSVEPAMLHQWNFRSIQRDIFTKNAFTQSWGCHSGEEYSQNWFKRTGVHMKGAIGKTDYSNGGLPFLSSEKGRWSQ